MGGNSDIWFSAVTRLTSPGVSRSANPELSD